tara:strand:- start:336 stop:512 length:177 start_codon:yes stop_codon:yes gene_type:complete
MEEITDIVLDEIIEEIRQGLLTKILKGIAGFFKKIKCSFNCCAESSCSYNEKDLEKQD